MQKTIAVRANKQIIAVFNRYAAVAGKQGKGRPQAIVDFITYVANLTDAEADLQLKAAAVMNIDISSVTDNIPPQIRASIDIDDEIWTSAIERFKKVFKLKTQPQMPYFLRVSGMAFINYTEKYNANKLGVISSVADIERFKCMSLDEKLIEIYKLLLESSERNRKVKGDTNNANQGSF